jgi:hypothetical protein
VENRPKTDITQFRGPAGLIAGTRVHRPISNRGSCACWREADLVAEGFELADGPALGLVWIAPEVVVGAGVGVDLAVGEHVTCCGENDVFNRDEGFFGTPAGSDPSVFLGEEGVP